MRIYFFRDSWIYIFPSILGKLVFDFFAIREICLSFRVIFEPTTFAGIIFHFFGDFSVIKARKLLQIRCKASPFDELAEGGLRTNHSDSNLEGLESAIMDKILETNLHFWRFCAHVRREYKLFSLTSPPPPTQCWKLLPAISSDFNMVLEPESNPLLEGKQRFFQTALLKHS